jgi:hypothetical protein
MKTTPLPDFLGPLPRGRILRMGDFYKAQYASQAAAVPSALEAETYGIDRADYPCYVIMALAILISILIPLLNWG